MSRTITTMLDLPQELYLMVCFYLHPKELINLSLVSRDHYLAVQQPLFARVQTNSYSALIKLVRTLMGVPVVSRITSKQRRDWYRLSDAQLRERDIRHLDLHLDVEEDGLRITGAVLSRCIEAISRKCEKAKISMTLTALSDKLLAELDNVSLPNVVNLTMFLGLPIERTEPRHIGPISVVGDSDRLKAKIWAFSFGGSSFPDLRKVYVNSLVDKPTNLPSTLANAWAVAAGIRPRRHGNNAISEDTDSFYGLARMEEIKLEYNTFLDGEILKSLFLSTVTPQRLTRLEITNCPHLHPIVDLEAISTLLIRGLQFLHSLKLHLVQHYDGYDGYEMAYVSKINDNPKQHLCNIVRELGQRIKLLDLAVPFACNHMFIPASRKQDQDDGTAPSPLPKLPDRPLRTLSQRLMDSGYRHRRLIFHMVCREAHDWDAMIDSAQDQPGKTSWEMLYDGNDEDGAAWAASGYAPLSRTLFGAMRLPFEAHQAF